MTIMEAGKVAPVIPIEPSADVTPGPPTEDVAEEIALAPPDGRLDVIRRGAIALKVVVVENVKAVATEAAAQFITAACIASTAVVTTNIRHRERGGEGTPHKPYGGFTAEHVDAKVVEDMIRQGGNFARLEAEAWGMSDRKLIKKWREVREAADRIEDLRAEGRHKEAEALGHSVLHQTSALEAVAHERNLKLKR